ncbi:MAG: DUF748 domain-containing protein [Steroidobacteraceae bacterium]
MGRRGWLVVAGISAGLLAAYALAGFLWVPRFVQSSVQESFERDYGRKVELARPGFNPFTFEFEARAFSVPDADGERLLGFDRLYLDFELSSLWRRSWTFGAIALERPYLRLVQRQDGSLNLSDLKPAEAADRDSADAAVPSFAIGELSVLEGQVDVLDRMRDEPFATSLRPVTFGLTDFHSRGEGNAFSFKAGSDRAGRLAVDGTLALGPFASKGRINFAGLPATTVSDYLGEALPVTLLAGRIDLDVAYDLSLAGKPFTLVLDLPTVAARELVTVAHGHEDAWQVPVLDLRESRVDVAARTVRIGSVELRDTVATAWLDERGFHSPGVALLPKSATAEAGEAPGAVAAAAAPAWQVEIPVIRMANASVTLQDRRIEPAASFGLVVQELQIGDFTFPQRAPWKVAGSLAAQSGGELGLAGTLEMNPLILAADVTTKALDLRAAQSYLDGDTDLKLRGGTLTSQGRLEFAAEGRPRLRYAGDLKVAGLHTADGTLGEDFINWSALEIRKLEFTQEPTRLAIREIVAKDPYLRLILAASGVTNILSVLDPEAAALRAAEIAAERAAGEKEGRDRGRRDEDEEVVPSPPVKSRLPARIGTIRIANGNVNFSDFTLQPPFQIAVERLAGTITGMTSVAGERARVELAGEVDRYAPATIEGELNLLAAQSYLDIAAKFRNIELTSFNPYSGKFAGYRIDKGKLSIETSYHVENRRLDAKHRFTLDQLQLGERVESPDAVSLPLKLAVALLKDRNGVIDIDLPVTGSLDDPQFRLGPIIWKAVLGLLGKIVTAPFALLGSLFGGGEDLSDLSFTTGAATLDSAAQEKIASLRKALVERPGLNIDVPSTVDPRADRESLAALRWNALLAGTDTADREAYRDRLLALYRERLGSKPDIPKPPRPAEGAPESDPVEHAIEFLVPKLREGVVVTDAELAALADARAQAVQEALLADGGIDPARVFLIRGEPATADGGTVTMVLSLK